MSIIKENWSMENPFKDKVSNMLESDKGNKSSSINPFLDKNGNLFNPYINYQKALDSNAVSDKAKSFIQQATGLAPTTAQTELSTGMTGGENSSFKLNTEADENDLASLDITTDLPKLSSSQISKIISKHFPNSTVISPSDAQGIYDAQQKSGMSALAILGIGALESGYGTSNIAKKKNNLWGWNATNVNPSGNATSFSQMSQGALEFANKYLKTYYNGYGAKSIYAAGTGSNPSGKGYAYNDDGSINSKWADDVGSIMKGFYQTAKSTDASAGSSSNNIVNAAQKYIGTPYVWGGSSAGQGVDCSGFVYSALKDAGYNIERTTAQGYRSYGTQVSKSNMQPGDLVFFGSGGKATHIGIYIGNGQMLHSSGGSNNTASNPGKGVCVTNVDYRNDFIEARRY